MQWGLLVSKRYYTKYNTILNTHEDKVNCVTTTCERYPSRSMQIVGTFGGNVGLLFYASRRW